MKNAFLLPLMFPAALAVAACAQPSSGGDRLTVAKAQREIKIGMSSSAVVEALGSPNMVTTDDERRETWVYDRALTEITSAGAVGGGWIVSGVGFGAVSGRSQSQKTLTIIVKFDEDSRVRDFAYKASSF
jgi:outer membrane protein assembly factor BamE (lipoprotein component of BamABCDE complex)